MLAQMLAQALQQRLWHQAVAAQQLLDCGQIQ